MIKANIVEIFSDIQGEGPLVGVRQMFVRFADCNRGCAYCDTPGSRTKVSTTRYSVPELIEALRRLDTPHGIHHSISITGGEPLLQLPFLEAFLPAAKDSGWRIYLETNATLPEEMAMVRDKVDFVAADAKLPSCTNDSGNLDTLGRFLDAARGKLLCVKAVVAPGVVNDELVTAAEILAARSPETPFIIQPATSDTHLKKKLLREIEDSLCGILFDVRVIPQVHLYLEQILDDE